MVNIYEKKDNLRKKHLGVRSQIDNNYRRSADKFICNALYEICVSKKAPDMVAAYISDGTEVDLTEFINRIIAIGIRVCVPRFNENSQTGQYELAEITDLNKDLRLGYCNIMEPVKECRTLEIKEYDNLLWLVPGVVFDEKLGRLGRGKGVYDQMIQSYDGINIGVFYECQKTFAVPMDKHDRSMDRIVTEKGIYR